MAIIEIDRNFHFHNEQGRGWSFYWGDPELWHYKDRLIVPGGKVLDLGCGDCRASTMFAYLDMEVIGYDLSEDAVDSINYHAKKHDIKIQAAVEDITKITLPRNEYDLVLLAQALIHFPSKQKAYDVLIKAYDALKPGGHLWVRTAGKEDDDYYRLRYEHGIDENDFPDVINDYCGCSGELKLEPRLFLEATELILFFTQRRAKIIHQQTIPETGRMNIMYGENWHSGFDKTSQALTILAQKT